LPGAPTGEHERMQIACVLYRPFTALDLVGAYQVFSSWPDAQLELVAATRDDVVDDVGVMSFTPTATFADLAAPDVVLVPGSSKPFASLDDEVLLAWLRTVEPNAKWMTSVCTGAGLLAAAGLLAGRRCATHWAYREVVRGMGADVVPERYVFDGKFVTGGGVTAGIDMALALTAREFGDETAKVVQLGMEYDPKPPFAGGTLETSEPGIVEAATAGLLAAAASEAPT
jgi:transcriptional regulator GlxA family with amidase domain